MLNIPTTRPSHGGNLTWAASLAGCSPSLLIDFSASISPFGPPSKTIAAIQNHLAQVDHYPDPNYTDLKDAIARHHTLSPDWILPGNGAAELLTWIGREAAAECTAILLPSPAFGDYHRAFQTFNLPIIPVTATHTQEWCFDFSFPTVSIQQSLGILINNPHNPTGLSFSVDRLQPLLDRFSLVVIDEAFIDFFPPSQQPSLISVIASYPNLVILRSLTKFYALPGLRIGYAIAHPDQLARWQRWRDPWTVNSIAAIAAQTCLTDGEFQQKIWDWLPHARQQLHAGMMEIKGLHPYAGAANYLLVQSERSVSQLQLQLLQDHKILIRDCHSFPELGDRFFRVAIRTESENQHLLSALNTIFSSATITT